jgi:hypothetical protein
MRHLPLFVVVLFAACASEEDMFRHAPSDRPVKLVMLEVEGSRSTIVASETVLFDVGHLPGVLAVTRGSGTNEVQCLVEMEVDPEDMVARLTPRYRVTVLRIVLREDLPPEEE